jgi:hypothetical protein
VELSLIIVIVVAAASVIYRVTAIFAIMHVVVVVVVIIVVVVKPWMLERIEHMLSACPSLGSGSALIGAVHYPAAGV